jgi:anthranilate/para-aminobenzoate synthase component I
MAAEHNPRPDVVLLPFRRPRANVSPSVPGRRDGAARAKLGAMPMTAIVVDIEPHPLSVARRLADRPGFAFLHDGSTGHRPSYVAVDPVESSSAWLPPGCTDMPAGSQDTRVGVPRWIGAIPYECARGLERAAWTRRPDERPFPHVVEPVWRRYAAVVEIDIAGGVVRVVGDDARRVDALAKHLTRGPTEFRPGAIQLRALDGDDPPAAHVDRIRRAQELIARGDLYQVNLARRLRFAAQGSPFHIYAALAREAPAPFGACLDLGDVIVCASSPELFLATGRRGAVRTAPIKGTRPRGAHAEADRLLARELDENPKEQAELTMILDVERNDLGRVAVAGSVRLLRAPAVETHRTVHHRLAVLGARLDPRRTQLDLLRAMFPSGSVTGAPKVRAMEVIAELEPARRGLYTGAFGSVAFDGSLTLAMAIRVLTLKRHEAHYYAGGGIVADSDPAAELDETRWKGAQLENLRETWPEEPS